MLDLSVIILTFNEEIHIRRCLENISDIAKKIYIIDCFSTDKTIEIAKTFDNVCILQHEWINYATQFNWAIENAKISTKWVMRLDADEYLTDDLKKEITQKLPYLNNNITGIVVPLLHVFQGKPIRRGMNQVKLLRLFRYGDASCEIRQMDEHIKLSRGETIEFKYEFVDENLNNISWWSQKHIGYAIREAADLLDIEFNLHESNENVENKSISKQAHNKRMLKYRYAKQPLFWRAFAYFCYRYFIRLGFLEGKEGFLWHFLQGWWYRTLVDAKIFEIKRICGNNREKIKVLLKEKYKISFEQ